VGVRDWYWKRVTRPGYRRAVKKAIVLTIYCALILPVQIVVVALAGLAAALCLMIGDRRSASDLWRVVWWSGD
jgi:hypothetical protein